MTQKEYQALQESIEQRCKDDLAALNRVYSLQMHFGLSADRSAPVERSNKVFGKADRSAAMKASWAKRRAKINPGEPNALPKKKFNEFLVNGAAS